ncbi:hypothetical protein DSO57_1024515 [Entomophthora muscae]|uniref:Uncharacterized protein n=1 Tax=Entomophthora muscae TaxID=34485 RepID=A0ACC2U0L0_9FUNG|nr:hypothetical protein DSO57_1024515 [Entomophthora muscae]
MIAYFKAVGFSDKQVALVSGACTFTGIVGTFISPHLVRRIGLRWAGNAFLSQEVFYLALVVIAIHLVPVHSVAFYLALLAGTILARAGLCGFDLVQTQMIQEGVGFEQLGIYVGFQFGLQNAFELGQYGLTTIWSDPDDFKYPATMSLLIVGMSLAIFFSHGYLKPNPINSHLL